jgi:regulatory protein
VDPYTLALTWLSRRELSSAQIRARLARRKFDRDDIEDAVARLTSSRAVDDRRVALAAARLEGVVRQRGRRRVLQRVRQLGISATVAEAAVDEVFREVSEADLLDAAIARKLRNAQPGDLDARAMARVVRSLIAQGFEAGAVYARLRARGAKALPGTE